MNLKLEKEKELIEELYKKEPEFVKKVTLLSLEDVLFLIDTNEEHKHLFEFINPSILKIVSPNLSFLNIKDRLIMIDKLVSFYPNIKEYIIQHNQLMSDIKSTHLLVLNKLDNIKTKDYNSYVPKEVKENEDFLVEHIDNVSGLLSSIDLKLRNIMQLRKRYLFDDTPIDKI